jgi:ribonucleoside-diphosphate reductase alpha chain
MTIANPHQIAPPAPAAPVRQRLPDTRRSITHKFQVGQHEGYLTVGFYEDGRPGELFIKIAKHGSTIAGLLDTVAVLTSIALQYGVPIEALARKFEFTRFEPSGWTKNPELRHVNSIVDYVFRWLGMVCSDEYRFAQAPENPLPPPVGLDERS